MMLTETVTVLSELSGSSLLTWLSCLITVSGLSLTRAGAAASAQSKQRGLTPHCCGCVTYGQPCYYSSNLLSAFHKLFTDLEIQQIQKKKTSEGAKFERWENFYCIIFHIYLFVVTVLFTLRQIEYFTRRMFNCFWQSDSTILLMWSKTLYIFLHKCWSYIFVLFHVMQSN